MTILHEYKTAHADAMTRNEKAAPSQKWVELGVTDSVKELEQIAREKIEQTNGWCSIDWGTSCLNSPEQPHHLYRFDLIHSAERTVYDIVFAIPKERVNQEDATDYVNQKLSDLKYNLEAYAATLR